MHPARLTVGKSSKTSVIKILRTRQKPAKTAFLTDFNTRMAFTNSFFCEDFSCHIRYRKNLIFAFSNILSMSNRKHPVLLAMLLALCSLTGAAQPTTTVSPRRTVLYRPGDFDSQFFRIPALITAKDGSNTSNITRLITPELDLSQVYQPHWQFWLFQAP